MARISLEQNIYYDEEKKLYYVYMDYGKDKNGKRIRKQPTFKKKTDAKKALKEFEADKTKGQLVKPTASTVEDWLKYWLDTIVKNSCEESTIYGYKNIINRHLIPYFGKISMQKLKPQMIQEYYNDKLNDKIHPISANTIRKHHALLKTAFHVATIQEVLLNNPIDKVIQPKYTDPNIRFYDVEEMKNLFKLVEDTRLECTTWIIGTTGIRRGELCGLSWDKIDFKNKLIQIEDTRINVGSRIIEKDTKNKMSTRKISISDELIFVILKEKNKQEVNRALLGHEYIESNYVIVMENGKPYRPNYLSELFTKFINDNDLPSITLHGLRHTIASVANSVGISLFDISKILGHSSPNTTGKIYTHVFDKSHKESMNTITNELSNHLKIVK